MTNAQALARAKARWGETAFTEYNPKALVGEDRAKLMEKMKQARERCHALRGGKSDQAKDAQRKAWIEFRKLQSLAIQRRCGVGYIHDSFLGPIHSMHGSGDTWEEACERAKI